MHDFMSKLRKLEPMQVILCLLAIAIMTVIGSVTAPVITRWQKIIEPDKPVMIHRPYQ